MADFIFRVVSVNLTAAQQQQVSTAIQGAVLAELAQLDLGGGSSCARGRRRIGRLPLSAEELVRRNHDPARRGCGRRKDHTDRVEQGLSPQVIPCQNQRSFAPVGNAKQARV